MAELIKGLTSGYQEAMDKLAYAEEIKKQAEGLINEMVRAAAFEVAGTIEERNALIDFVYWNMPEAKTKWIAESFGISQYDIPNLIGLGKVTRHCSKCGREIEIEVSSRTEADQVRREKIRMCADCWSTQRETNQRDYEASQRQREARLAQLQKMTLQEYAQTEEFNEQYIRENQGNAPYCDTCGRQERTMYLYLKNPHARGWPQAHGFVTVCNNCLKALKSSAPESVESAIRVIFLPNPRSSGHMDAYNIMPITD